MAQVLISHLGYEYYIQTEGRAWSATDHRQTELSLSTTPTTYASVQLPQAGTYRMLIGQRLRQQTATAVTTHLFSATASNLVEMSGSWRRSKGGVGTDTGQSYVATSMVSTQGSVAGDVHEISWDGHVTVSGAATLNLRCTLGNGTGHMLPGSVVQVLYKSSNTAPTGISKYVQIASGAGYEGSTYSSTDPVTGAASAGQWTADGVAISGQTGSTYVLTRDHLGKAIRCTADSNAVQMWTPKHLPDVYKTNGGWWDPGDASSVTLNGGNIASIANQFTGGADMSQGTGSLQPPYNVGGYVDFPSSNQVTGYGLSGTNLACAYFICAAQYRDGNTSAFVTSNNACLVQRSGGNDRVIGIALNSYVNTNSSRSDQGVVRRNGADGAGAILPLDKSVIDCAAGTRWATLGTRGPYAEEPSQNWQGALWEWMYLAKAPTADLRARIQGFWAWHLGIQTKLPADHPYYVYPPRLS